MKKWVGKEATKMKKVIEEFGDNGLPKIDKTLSFIAFGILEIIFIFGHLYLFGLIFNPSSYLTLLVFVFIIYCTGSLLFLVIEITTQKENKIAFIVAFHHIIMFIFSFYIAYRILPYRGEDTMILRNIKLKRVIRKTRMERLKFWNKWIG